MNGGKLIEDSTDLLKSVIKGIVNGKFKNQPVLYKNIKKMWKDLGRI
jgi:hypothetical protein